MAVVSSEHPAAAMKERWRAIGTTSITKTRYLDEQHQRRVIDPNNNSTLFTFDNLGRTIREAEEPVDANGNVVTPASTARTWVFDAYGNLEKYTDRRNKAMKYEYDNLNRRTAEIDLANTGADATFSYNAYGDLETAGNDNATYIYEYDDRGLNTSIAVASSLITGNLPSSTAFASLSSHYDALGRRDALTVKTALSSNAIVDLAFQHDTIGRLTRVTENLGRTKDSAGNFNSAPLLDVEYKYKGLLQDEIIRNKAGASSALVTTFSGDPGSSLKMKTQWANAGSTSTPVSAFDYYFNVLGQVKSKTEQIGSKTSTQAFTYRADGQLKTDSLDINRDYDLGGNDKLDTYTGSSD